MSPMQSVRPRTAMSSQSTALAPGTLNSRLSAPCLSRAKTRGASPLSLCVHRVPSGASASPESSVAAGAVTRPSSRTDSLLRQSAGTGLAGTGGGTGAAGGLSPHPAATSAAKSSTRRAATERCASGDALVARGRGGETAARAFLDELGEAGRPAGAGRDAHGKRGVERRPPQVLVDGHADVIAPRPGGHVQV